jgi:hypothetical protein
LTRTRAYGFGFPANPLHSWIVKRRIPESIITLQQLIKRAKRAAVLTCSINTTTYSTQRQE